MYPLRLIISSLRLRTFRPSFAFLHLLQVADPQTVTGTFSSFTSYLISSTICSEGVRRRYSDFDWLREVLVARYHGIAVPLMPEKRLVGNQGKAFIEERMQGLESFLGLLLANPYLRQDATVRMFLQQGGTAEFEQAKKATLQGVGADPASNLGLGRWFAVLRHLTLPVDADAACRELSAHCAETEAKLVATLAACNKYYDSAKALSESLKAVKESLSDFHASANNSAAALSDSLAPLKVATNALGARLKRTADAFSNAHDLSVFSPNEIQIFLLDGLISEIHRVRGLKSLLEVRESAQKEYSAAWQAQDKLAFQEKGFREKGRADKADALAPKVAEAVAFMRRMKERLDDISKGVLHIEAERLARTRVDRIVAMAGQFAALCIASGVRGQELWSSFLAAQELDQAAMVRDAQATLTSQMSMHALDATGPAVGYVLPGSVIADAAPIAINSSNGGASSSSGGAFGGAGAAASALSSEGSSSSVPAPAFTGTATSGDAVPKEESVDL